MNEEQTRMHKDTSEVPLMDDKEGKSEHPRVLVKGYMRPDGTSYYVVIPKKIRELFNLNGGEYFLMKAKPEKGTIKLKLVEFADEEPEKELETK
jgi:AbrB family looped-hinge helix DNA binding protein